MITILGSIIGFIGALVPEVIKWFGDRADQRHELAILQLQLEKERQNQALPRDAITSERDIQELTALYQTYRSGVQWVDALNGTVRPVLAYSFFLLYAMVKAWQFSLVKEAPMPWHITSLWGEEDQAIFASIISFYFGARALQKARQR